MSNYNSKTNKNIEDINGKDPFECAPSEKLELFKQALSEAVNSKIDKEIEDIEMAPISKRHKIIMNRIFRERVGGTFLPYPEADSFFERARSNIIVKLQINEFLDSRKKRKQKIYGRK